MIDRFAKYHPAVNFLYFTLVIGFSMALNHPLAQGISLACAIIYKMVLLYLGFCGFYLLSGMIVSAFGFRYFPSIRYIGLNAMTLSFQFVYLIMCLMPVVLNWAEERKWKAIHSKM